MEDVTCKVVIGFQPWTYGRVGKTSIVIASDSEAIWHKQILRLRPSDFAQDEICLTPSPMAWSYFNFEVVGGRGRDVGVCTINVRLLSVMPFFW